ncbi:D-alanyl-D-alanine carboxypeptidase/D-alanyl-D-alanine endopeptidase [Streptomyces sp. DR3-1]|uniref:D-alanyl-D-alanine carboxypeptidase/D-alanyl-D-alanine endopeptidase n=1 Tax=Streptomyces sp. DR3-1 TaxID=2951169 RepID=UPI002042EC35|nr:D-alanyl-D-alanine carboxypeptidase/D-alanyl-D-alanine-endopeptidase [Streptomyces sp. DR3-1]MCM3820002.1 D-alanyl-D-alanine carboxypeptidase/D-alanyl-D-alanine-endopeptidase [Streptomyces sp. DR3-1]
MSGRGGWRLKTWQFTAAAAVSGLALASAAAAAAGPWDSGGQRTAESRRAALLPGTGDGDHRTEAGSPLPAGSDPVASEAAAVLAPLEAGDLAPRTGEGAREAAAGQAPAPTAAALKFALEPLLKAKGLGPGATASVVDAATGKELYGRGAKTAMVPASTVKIATGTAALSVLGPDHRIRTTVVAERGPGYEDGAPPERIVLVGGGDPTLTARADAGDNASLRTLARHAADTLKQRGARTVRLAYDTSAYSGSTRHPIGPNENLAPVTALMADEGRLDTSTSGPAPRSTRPAQDAADAFARFLAERGVKVEGAVREAAATDQAEKLADVRSAPLSALVERMLTHSDNDIAEALARQTALAAGAKADFAGAERETRRALDRLGLPLDGARFADGSGLDRADRVTARLLTSLLARAAHTDHPELRPVLTGLPVAGFSGTLAGRYTDPEAAAGTGVVRAKTGTLTGVNTLAGTVVSTDGRLLTFSFLASATTDPTTAQSTLDHLASTLAHCGC